MRLLLSLAALTLLTSPSACASDKVSPADAKKALALFELAPNGSGGDSAQELRVLMQGCSELKSCAGGCERALAAGVKDGVDCEQRSHILAECFRDFREEREKDKAAGSDGWFARYMGQYAERARPVLDPGEQKRLDAAITKLGLTTKR